MPVQQENDANVWHQVICTHRKGGFMAQPHWDYTALRVAIYHHLCGLFGLLKAFEVDRPKTSPCPKLQKFHDISHFVVSSLSFQVFQDIICSFKNSTKYLERNLERIKVRIFTYLIAVSIATTWAAKLKDIIIQLMGPEWRTYTKSFSFVEDCHLSSTIYFHRDKNGRRSICSDWASFIQRPAGSNAPLYYI